VRRFSMLGKTVRGRLRLEALSASVPAGQFITATATDPGGNTSEFSRAVRARTNALRFASESLVVTPNSSGGVSWTSPGEVNMIPATQTPLSNRRDDNETPLLTPTLVRQPAPVIASPRPIQAVVESGARTEILAVEIDPV
jgi:hypothetical protein